MIKPFGTLRTIFAAGSHAEIVGPADPETVESLKARLDAAAQVRLGRCLAIRHVNTGSCNGCELELRALSNIVYDLERFGLCFVDSPRHADVLLVTGPLTRNLQTSLTQAWDATPDPNGSFQSEIAPSMAVSSKVATPFWVAPAFAFRST